MFQTGSTLIDSCAAVPSLSFLLSHVPRPGKAKQTKTRKMSNKHGCFSHQKSNVFEDGHVNPPKNPRPLAGGAAKTPGATWPSRSGLNSQTSLELTPTAVPKKLQKC